MVLRYIMERRHYDEELELAGDKLIILCWSATWCGHYVDFDPTLMKMSDENKDVVFVCCDQDDGKEFVDEMNIGSVPEFWFIKKKVVLEKIEGVDEPKIRELMNKFR